MKTVTTTQLRSRLSMLQGRPRVVVSGNLATPWKAVEALDHAVPTYILNILNGGEGIPAREGVIAETCFIGAGQRHHPALSYVPCRLSMVPVLLRRRLRADVVIVHCERTHRCDGRRAGARRIHPADPGFGGQTDFIVGAMHSPGGHSFIALRSWHPKADVSTVVPRLADTTTSFQQSAIVTEQGIAFLLGNDEKQQATEIIEKAAHPDVRDELRSAAAEFGLDNPIY